MSAQIRIEIVARDAFWRNAVLVVWECNHPERKLTSEAKGSYLIQPDWLEDLKVVAAECFSKIVVAPSDPSRRSWFRMLLPGRDDRES